MEIRLRSSLPCRCISSGKDLVVDRSAFDRIQHAGGFISVNTSGNPVDANAIQLTKGC
jgi:hypothetical protein